jgi:hypothetical protein
MKNDTRKFVNKEEMIDYNLTLFLQNFNSLKNQAITGLFALEISNKNVEIKLRNLINTLTELLRQSDFYETTKLMAETLKELENDTHKT